MRGIGGERVIRSLISYSRKLGIKALLVTLPYKAKEREEFELYKAYTAECLRLITLNSAKYTGGTYLTKSYLDLVNPKEEQENDAEEIIQDVIKKAGLEVIP